MSYLLGMSIAFFGILLSIFHLKQSLVIYFDWVAAIVVIGGTLAISLMIFPWKYFREFVSGLRTLIFPSAITGKDIAIQGLNLLQGRPADLKKNHIAYQTLQDGAELIALGFPAEKIQTILMKRIANEESRLQIVGNTIRSMSKYPPAFGLMGTVLGLVSLMRAIAASSSGEEVGIRMAVALVATLYGLVISNFILNPLGEKLTKIGAEESKLGLLAVEAIILVCNRVSVLEAQEILNSSLPPYARVNLFKNSEGSSS